LDIPIQDKLLVLKEEPEDIKGIHIRGPKRHNIKQSMEKQEKSIAYNKYMKLRKTRKDKPVVNYPRRSKTRTTNNLRLNSKALFNPSIKKDNIIVIDDDTVENTEDEKGQSPVTSSHKWKKVKLESKDEYHDVDTMEKQQKDKKGKQIVEHHMRHVTRETKKIRLKSKTLPKSSLKKGRSTDLEDNLVDVEIKPKFNFFPVTEELQNFQEMKMLESVEAEEIIGGSS
jgi:hypothetical protein